MKQAIEKFFEFNGKTLVFLSENGVYWVAIKPVCEAIGVNYNRAFQNLKADPILTAAFAVQQMQVPGDQTRNMVSLPEKYIYGWLFSLKSASPELLKYKMLCYETLYEYFHGTITRRKKLIEEKVKIQMERNTVTKELLDNENFIKLNDLQAREARIGKELKEMDSIEIKEQTSLFDN